MAGSLADQSRVSQWLSDMSLGEAESSGQLSEHRTGQPSIRIPIAALTQLVQSATLREAPRLQDVGLELGQRLADRMRLATSAWEGGIEAVRRETEQAQRTMNAASLENAVTPSRDHAARKTRQGASTPANCNLQDRSATPALQAVSAERNRGPGPSHWDVGRTPGGYQTFYGGIRDDRSRVRFGRREPEHSTIQEDTYSMPPTQQSAAPGGNAARQQRQQAASRVNSGRAPFQATLANFYQPPEAEFAADVAEYDHATNDRRQGGVRQMLARFPRLDIDVFEGDVPKWLEFAASFKQCVHDVVPDAGLRMTYLRKYLSPNVRARFQHLFYDERCYFRVLDALEFQYDRPELVARIHLTAIEAAPSCSEGDYSGLSSLSRKLNEATACLTNVGCRADLCSQTLLGDMARKLPPTLRLEWGREVRRRGGYRRCR